MFNVQNAAMKHNINGKGIMAPMEYTLLVYSPNGKSMVLWKIVFEVIVMVKDKRIPYKRHNVNQNLYYALHEVDKSNVASSFWGIWNGLYFFATFFFHCHCQLVKGQF